MCSGGRLLLGGGVKSIERTHRIHECGSGVDVDRHAQGFGNFFLARPMLACGRSVDRDTAVTPQAHPYSERHQFPGLGVEMPGFLACSAQDAVAPDGVGTELAEAGRGREKLIAIVVPVVHVHENLRIRPRYAGGNRLRTSAEAILAAERNSFADRINEQRPPTDPLSAIAPLLRVRQVEVQDLCRFASAWRSPHTAEAPTWAQFPMGTKGNCFLDLENGETFHLQAGSLLLLPRGDAHIVRSSHGGRSRAVPVRVEYNNAIRVKTNTLGSSDTELICGRLQFDEAQSGLIVTALPPAIVLNVSSAQALGHMRSLIQMIDEELRSARAGALAIATDLSSALFVLMLRVHFEQAEPSSGLLKLLRSPVCAKAVNAIVNDPAHDWTLDALAHRAHVSRATLVRAFQKAAGMAPLAFLAEVRLNLARQSLASTTASLLQVSTAVGYASESAFVRAFKRRFGISPGKIRSR